MNAMPNHTPNPRQVEPEPTVARYHSPLEEPPEPYKNNGPLEGSKRYLASVLCIGNHPDRRAVDSLVKSGVLWGQELHYRHYRIWFHCPHDFQRAKKAADTQQGATDSQ